MEEDHDTLLEHVKELKKIVRREGGNGGPHAVTVRLSDVKPKPDSQIIQNRLPQNKSVKIITVSRESVRIEYIKGINRRKGCIAPQNLTPIESSHE